MHISLIAVPPVDTKKKQDRIFPFSSSLNYGLLALATYLNRHGYDARVYDPCNWRGGQAVQSTIEWLRQHRSQYIGLSCISGFSYPSFRALAQEIRVAFPNIPIIAGGKDHLALIAKRVFEECPEIDVIVLGEGEIPMLSIMEKGFSVSNLDRLERIPNVITRLDKVHDSHHEMDSMRIPAVLGSLNYRLHEDFRLHPPCIEVGRGCPYGCHFCTNDRKRIIKKTPKTIIDEATELIKLYRQSDLSLYFQTPMLLMQDDELAQLCDLRNTKGLSFCWRAQTRVEYLTDTKIRLLAKAGARVIDLGFESGSREMLSEMDKSKNPGNYLAAAKAVLKAAKEEGIIIKLNILFYAGERRATLLETYDFLEENSDGLWTISAYPLLIYPGTMLTNTIASLLQKRGGSLVNDKIWRERHLIPVNPSSEFTYEDMQHMGILFGKAFQTSKTYFNERHHGYYRPGITYDDFIRSASEVGYGYLPCSPTETDMLQSREKLRALLENAEKPVWE